MDINKIRKMFDDKILLTCLSPLFLLRQNKNLIVFSKNLIFILRNLIVFSTKIYLIAYSHANIYIHASFPTVYENHLKKKNRACEYFHAQSCLRLTNCWIFYYCSTV